MLKQLLFCFICVCLTVPAFCQQETQLFYKANDDLTEVIVYDVFSPPVASRIYYYSAVAAYETILRANQKSSFISLCNQLNQLKALPNPSTKINAVVAGLSAFYNTAIHFVFSEQKLTAHFQKTLSSLSKIKKENAGLYQRSLSYGKQISDSIFEWSKNDNYAYTRKLRRYNFSKSPGKWVPTPPAYFAAVEPYWGKMRTAIKNSSDTCIIQGPLLYSTDSSSDFYHQAKEVFFISNNLSGEQKDIANFWDCNPFKVNTSGHLLFAAKKLSPGAHWMNIVNISSRKQHADLVTSAAAYALAAITIYDAFIHCWTEKYKSNLIRPETYINANIDANWRPVLQTPPFPEYPSGHSVISTAAAIVLTDFFGDNFKFNDDTEMIYGLPMRSFTSFTAAANEAAISRLYGGIHFRAAIENGQQLGKKTGEYVLKNLHIRSQ
jgi:hypothetical protein